MNQPTALRPNPLYQRARSTSPRLGTVLSLLGRATGIGLALAVAIDQDFTPTRALGLAVATLILLTIIPFKHERLHSLPWTGAGVLVFAGALLASQSGGKAMIVAGVVTALGAVVTDAHARRRTGAPSFFIGLGLVVLTFAAIVVGFGG